MNPQEVELHLLSLKYERQISRAHTIFSSFWDIFFGIIVGTLGIFLALIEINAFEFNRLSFILTITILGFIIQTIGVIAYYNWNESKVERKKIEEKISALATA